MFVIHVYIDIHATKKKELHLKINNSIIFLSCTRYGIMNSLSKKKSKKTKNTSHRITKKVKTKKHII